MREFFRSNSRHDQLDGSFIDPPDRRADLDSALVSAEAKKHVQRVLDQLSERDREVLREVFLEDEIGDRDQLCRRLGIERDYLGCSSIAPRRTLSLCTRACWRRRPKNRKWDETLYPLPALSG